MNSSSLIVNPADYGDANMESLWEVLSHRIAVQPINLIFAALFGCALIHTFFAHRFYLLAASKEEQLLYDGDALRKPHKSNFSSDVLTFLSEIEVIFGIWCIPLLVIITLFYDWETTLYYINNRSYEESLFIIPTMALASTYPIFNLTEKILGKIAGLKHGTPSAWWWCIMTLGPILGSVIKETVAMTLSALLLSSYFFRYQPSKRLAYATIGLLFVNISMGGTLTNFGNFSVSVATKAWKWDTQFVFSFFGWKAILSILLSNLSYFLIFKKDFQDMKAAAFPGETNPIQVPFWVTAIHILTLTWIIFNGGQTVIALGSFVLFLGFYEATSEYQTPLGLRSPVMVGFFLASLMIFGSLQNWWLEPILVRLTDTWALGTSVILSAFTHNALFNYLATQIPNLTLSLKQAIFAGTMIGGGLTVMANGPNLVGCALLKHHFENDISMKNVFISALLPTLIAALCYLLI